MDVFVVYVRGWVFEYVHSYVRLIMCIYRMCVFMHISQFWVKVWHSFMSFDFQMNQTSVNICLDRIFVYSEYTMSSAFKIHISDVDKKVPLCKSLFWLKQQYQHENYNSSTKEEPDQERSKPRSSGPHFRQHESPQSTPILATALEVEYVTYNMEYRKSSGNEA